MEISSKKFSYDALLCDRKLVVPAGELFQVSETFVIKGGEIAEHMQYCDEITYVTSGKAMFYSDENCEEVHEGQIHYIKKGRHHKIVADDNQNFNYICIGFAPDSTNDEIKSFLDMRERTDCFVKDDDGSVRRLMKLLLNEFYMLDEQNTLMIKYFFLQILIFVARIYKGEVQYIDKKSTSTSNYAVYKALRHIDRSYMYITSVKNVAKELSYSEYYLSHIFAQKVGVSIKEYITKKKLQAAEEMLRISDLSIDELSEYLNFGSTHTFRQAFKKMYLASPSEYRKKYRKF